VEPLEAGDPLPEYHLVNELGQKVSLSQYKGNALVLSFLFTRCPIPTFCPLTARKLVETQEQLLANRNGPTNWHILAITVDPEFDTPQRLKEFGETYGYQPGQFSLLTGELIDITALAEQFGLLFWTEEGSISHNLRTAVVDANGIIQTNMVGNEWKVETLVKDVTEAAAGGGKKD
jgi:protein SCO1/2